MTRCITDMVYGGDNNSPKAPGIEYNPDPELDYLRSFWAYMTADLTLTELRQVNDHIECDFGVLAPAEYSI